MKCPLLLLYAVPASYGKETLDRTIRFIKSLRNSENECKVIPLEGTHHFHMIKPEATAQVILKFFAENLSRLRKIQSKL
jgi:hypothetical protein